MPTTNFFFNTTSYVPEQNLLNDLTVEMIKAFGVEVIYLPRTTPNIDKLFLEDPTSKFINAINIEVYIKDFNGWRGEGDMMSKFGISMADQITFCLSRTRFAEDIGSIYNMIRPLEGDLIYFSIPNAIFEIKFVEHEAVFYQTGGLQFYELRCERWNYSDEQIDTGVPEVDIIEQEYTFASDGYRIVTESGLILNTEFGARLLSDSYEDDLIDTTTQNTFFDTQGRNMQFSATNPFGD